MRKTKNYLKKKQNDIEKLHPDFSEGKEERPAGHVVVFLPKSRYSHYRPLLKQKITFFYRNNKTR